MGSGNKRNLDDEKVGIIPRVVREVFRLTKEAHEKGEQRVEVRVSYLEIYNELLRDLLHPRSSSGKPVPISIREGPNSAIQLVGIKEEPVSNYSEMMRYLERGSVSRTTASTLMNSYSSRSHSIFTITIVQRSTSAGNEQQSTSAGKNKQKRKYKKSKFHLVDLAGSERAKRTGAVGARFKESITINKGLLALGNVISALCASQAKRTHIPYRNSKLTRLLQDSLGGNSRTLMIACISPADINFEESLTTLKYADRAKKIKNRAIINEEEEKRMEEVKQMKEEIESLNQQLSKLRPNQLARDLESEMESIKGKLKDRQAEVASLREMRDWLLLGVQKLTTSLQNIEATESQREGVKKRVLKMRSDYEVVSKDKKTSKEELALMVKAIKAEQTSYVNLKAHVAKAKSNLQSAIKTYISPEVKLEERWGVVTAPPPTDVVPPLKKLDMSNVKKEAGIQTISGEPLDTERGFLVDDKQAEEDSSKNDDAASIESKNAAARNPIHGDGDAKRKGDGDDDEDGQRAGGGKLVRMVQTLQEALAVEGKRRSDIEQALVLAREDLARDDVIFEAKMVEIRKWREKEAAALNEVNALRKEIESLRNALSSSPSRRNKNNNMNNANVMDGAGEEMGVRIVREDDDNDRDDGPSGRPHRTDDDLRASAAWMRRVSSVRGEGKERLLERLEEDDIVLQDDEAYPPPSRARTAPGSDGVSYPTGRGKRLPQQTHHVAQSMIITTHSSKTKSHQHQRRNQQLHHRQKQGRGQNRLIRINKANEEREKSAVIVERVRLQREKNLLESSIKGARKAYTRKQENWTRELRDMNIQLQMKNELLSQATGKKNLSKKEKDQILNKMGGIDHEIEKFNAALHRLEQQRNSAATTPQEKKKHERNSERVYEAIDRLNYAKEQLISRMEEARETEQKIETIRQEMNSIRKQEIAVRKHAKVEYDRHHGVMEGLERDLRVVIREIDMQTRLIKKLENTSSSATGGEGETAGQQYQNITPKITGGGAAFWGDNSPSSWQAGERPRTAPGKHVESREEWMEEEIDRFMIQTEIKEKMRQEIDQKRDIEKERDNILREKERMEMANVRRSQVVASSLINLKSKLRRVDEALNLKQGDLRRATITTAAGATGSDGLKEEIVSLKEERKTLLKEQASLESQMEGLAQNEGLVSVKDRIESLEALIDYKTEKIQQMAAKAAGVDRKEFLKRLTKMIKPSKEEEAREITRRFCQLAIDLRETKLRSREREEKSTLEIEEKSRLVSELSQNLQDVTKDYEDRLRQMEEQIVGSQTTMRRYKETNTALKAKIQALVDVDSLMMPATMTTSPQQQQEQHRILQKENEQLKEEMKGLKKYVRDVQAYISAKKQAKKQQQQQHSVDKEVGGQRRANTSAGIAGYQHKEDVASRDPRRPNSARPASSATSFQRADKDDMFS
mmetsp:Transcript_20771/g.34088  ORF Transcript_20771/g.34088 Transcript_20771/m.34088 type:complete len:1426 (-) Transcript_20771:300-4577(-)